MSTSALNALSPLDGRYAAKVDALRSLTSEAAFMRHRVKVEVEWLIALSDAGLPELPSLSAAARQHLRGLVDAFGDAQAARIKEIERVTNHDVKAVEYFLKESVRDLPELVRSAEFIHFACTSEDINNTSHALMLAGARDRCCCPRSTTSSVRCARSRMPMPMCRCCRARTVSPPRRPRRRQGDRQRRDAAGDRAQPTGPGAHPRQGSTVRWATTTPIWRPVPTSTGNRFSRGVVESLGLGFNPWTIQIEPHDYMAELFDAVARLNTILIDLDRDLWGYISLGYFRQRLKAGEIGSSTMPHKVNPIDFENSEGNLGIANALLRHLAEKLPVSRWQRDLTDSTVLRNMGVALGYSLLAWDACARGLAKLELDRERLSADLDACWEVLAEPIQTVMRRHGVENPYEQLKELTRGKSITPQALADFVDGLAYSGGGEGEIAGDDAGILRRQGGRTGSALLIPAATDVIALSLGAT
jgi:adenylosuccinate lyase